MPIYFSKEWHSGTDRDSSPGTVLDPQPDWPKPDFRPGWTISYLTSDGKTHVGKIRFVFQAAEYQPQYYRIIRLKNDAREVSFAHKIIGKIEQE